MATLTNPQRSALKWLKNRGGDGVFDKGHVLNARGERAGSDDCGGYGASHCHSCTISTGEAA